MYILEPFWTIFHLPFFFVSFFFYLLRFFSREQVGGITLPPENDYEREFLLIIIFS